MVASVVVLSVGLWTSLSSITVIIGSMLKLELNSGGIADTGAGWVPFLRVKLLNLMRECVDGMNEENKQLPYMSTRERENCGCDSISVSPSD